MESDQDLVTRLLSKLSATFKIRNLSEPGFFLGIETIKCDDGLLLSQQRYMNDILKCAGMAECKALSTPISVSKSITFSADLYEDPTQYRSLARKQKTVARSSTEAEYKALADAYAELIWIVSLLREIKVSGISVPRSGRCDNLGDTYICANPIFHARTKHVEIDYHFVRDRVASGDIQLYSSHLDNINEIYISRSNYLLCIFR
ncbi:PREDICTED: uncharacterized protein LOC109175103 [Ipomoea nil]|uniref:uncharacterized protein LOC109175103 n=1 Tax=Ipomoea nil TaxID=35883 RepID=UPI0009018588|nr:PREDICTED: uncharacterized protein LOC109175103 [Ipomoea nil]